MTARPLTLPDVLEVMADAIGERTAVITADDQWTYAEIDDRATRLANVLLADGLQPGDAVAVHASNRIEWMDAFYGCLKARGVPININYRYKHDELLHLYGDSAARFALVAPEHLDLARGVAGELGTVDKIYPLDDSYADLLADASTARPAVARTDDDPYVLYTGGTTGNPKGVVWRQADAIPGAMNGLRFNMPIESVEKLAEEATANENPITTATAGPLMHGGSQWIMCSCLVGGGVFICYTEPSFDPERYLDLVQSSNALSMVVLGDAMARPIAEAVLAAPGRWELKGLTAVSNGAAPLSEAVRAQTRAAFPDRLIRDSYGSSESGYTSERFDDGKAYDSPRFANDDNVMVLGPDHKPAAVGEVGMLARSGHIPLGYLNDPEKTAATFIEIDGRRWAVPGDAARREEDGTVTVLGRGSGSINTGGEKVFPEEVEGALLAHPNVEDAAVVGTPHPRWGEMVVAIISLRAPASSDADAIRAHVRDRLADYKVPKEVIIVNKVPRTAVSKVDYRAAKELAAQRLSS